jgi:pimeloyl-ACP methyl ester carboxylesterase
VLLAGAVGFFGGSGATQASGAQTMEGSATTLRMHGHAPVHGIQLYYEVHGPEGKVPVVLLHGGGSTIETSFGRLLPLLASDRRVIAVEEQGHGRSSDRDGPVTFEGSAEDVAGLLEYLGIARADCFGFSNGGSVALQLAIRHPERVRKLVLASVLTKRDGARPEFWEFIGQADFSVMPQALKEGFLRVNPDAAQLRRMHDKDLARMRAFVDVPDASLRALRMPTLIMQGDRDIARVEHVAALARLIPDARLLVLPAGHGDYLGEAASSPEGSSYPALTAALIGQFLDAE